MKTPKYSKAFQIALSAIACAFAVLFLYVGTLSGFLLASGFFFAEICLMIPLSKNFYVGNVLAFLGTLLLTVLMGVLSVGWRLVPFALFFGLHPLANRLQQRFHIPCLVGYIVKAAWFIGMLFASYFIEFHGILEFPDYPIFAVIEEHLYLFFVVGGALFLLIYDYAMFKIQALVDQMVYRIRK